MAVESNGAVLHMALASVLVFGVGLAHQYGPVATQGAPPDSHDLQLCEKIVGAILYEPTSYHRVRIMPVEDPASDISIEFEANAYGTPFRRFAECHFYAGSDHSIEADVDGHPIAEDLIRDMTRL